MNEPLLQIDHLTKAYGETTILKDVSFSVGQGEVVVIIGPSGCGKSTLLRCINALEPIQGGQVRLNGQVIGQGAKDQPALRRRIGMVFQSYELFPHLTVLENILLAPDVYKRQPVPLAAAHYIGNGTLILALAVHGSVDHCLGPALHQQRAPLRREMCIRDRAAALPPLLRPHGVGAFPHAARCRKRHPGGGAHPAGRNDVSH